MATSKYVPGRKAQYGKDRWERYEDLRVAGFTKKEARALSRVEKDDPVIKRMTRIRKTQLTKFNKLAKGEGWEGGSKSYHWYKGLRKWYQERRFTTKGAVVVRKGKEVETPKGLSSIFAWFRAVEKRLARASEMSIPEFRRKRKTPLYGKGMVQAQKQRARLRGKAYREGVISSPKDKVPASFVRQSIAGLRETARREPSRKAQMEKQARNLGFKGRF